LGVFGHSPKISKCPYAKNIIDTAFSFEDRSGATMSFEHVNFQPRASKTQKIFSSNGPYHEKICDMSDAKPLSNLDLDFPSQVAREPIAERHLTL
jgi:hypothetical protein